METLESSRVCRLCGKQSGISINIFDKNENHVKKINVVLPIMVHEMDLLPKHMCHRCSYKLEEFHKFYIDCLKTDEDLKSQLSWMKKGDPEVRVGVPMVHIENIKIKVEPPDYDAYEMNSIVDNVDYINTIGPVAFPVNSVRSEDLSKDITYTAYTRCGCCCDNAGQSNQTVRADFNNRISRCNRIGNVRPRINNSDNKSQSVRTNFVDGKPFQDRGGFLTFVDRAAFNLTPSKGKFTKLNAKSPRTPIVRNLRPRRNSINYAGSKRKLSAGVLRNSKDKPKSTRATSITSAAVDVAQIKVEKLDDFAGRILRPRKGTIDYVGPKRKYSRTIGKNQRSQDDRYRSEKLSAGRINLSIKEEQVTDPEGMVLEESAKKLPKNRIGNLIDEIDELPSNRVADLQNEPCNHGALKNPEYTSRSVGVFNKWKRLKNPTTEEAKARKGAFNRFEDPPKHLRSHGIDLRNGEVKKLKRVDVSARKLRKSIRNLAKGGKITRSGVFKTIRNSVKKTTSSINLIDNVKHYCEGCNASFANRELFKLHACYGH